MRRRKLVAIVTMIALAVPVTQAAAAPPATPANGTNPAPHADVRGTHISASLENSLRVAGPRERVEVIVTWTGRSNVAAARAAAGPFQVIEEFTVIDGFLAAVTPGQARALARVPGVFRIDDNFTVEATNEQADRDYGTETARSEFGVDGSGIKVCVLDTGADPNHEQLDSRIAAFYDAINGQGSPYDDQGHGTHVAATIAGDGVGNSVNAIRYQGIAPGASLYIAKVLSSAGSGTTAQIIDGMQWCLAQNVDIISASLGSSTGSDGLDALSQAVNNAVNDHGVVATIAAGNAGDGPESVGSPGAAQAAITVGASSKFGPGLHLAPFSSRGPNLAGVLKPDVVSPGVAVTSADAGTTAGYVAYSGTSMATPFTAGTVALAMEANPSLSASDVKNLVTSTARDAGISGPDNNWGHGLIDGYGLVSSALGGNAIGLLPGHTFVAGSVPNSGLWSHDIAIAGDAVGQPLGITALIEGEIICTFEFFGICLLSEWSPDLDARLISPDGTITDSRCALEGDCGATGTQETFHVGSALAGTYKLEIYPFAGNPNNGLGGSFGVDIFTGPPGGSQPPTNTAPIAAAGADQVVDDSDGLAGEAVVLDGTGSIDPDGTIMSWEWSEGATALGNGETLGLDLADGVHTITLTVTDNLGATGTDDVVVTVVAPAANVAPSADAGADRTIPDSNGQPGESVTLDGSGSDDSDGSIVSWAWSEGSDSIGSGETVAVDLADGVHTITLTVTDDRGATASDDVVITVQAPVSGASIHVGDLDGTAVNISKSRWRASVTVAVHDQNGAAVAGTVVHFTLSTGQNVSCTTTISGLCTAQSPEYRKRTTDVTFTVVNLIGPSPYVAGDNHDPDGDSSGTSITLSRP